MKVNVEKCRVMHLRRKGVKRSDEKGFMFVARRLK